MNDARTPTSKIVLLAQRRAHANLVYNALASRYAIGAVLLESRIGGWTLVERRIKRLGFWKREIFLLGSLIFLAGAAAVSAQSRERQQALGRGLL